MNFVELVVLLPCHGLEDFPLHHQGEEAESLLAAWSAPWHPALIAAAGAAPRWYRMDAPPAEVRGRLIVLPSVGQERLPIGFVERCKNNGASLIRRFKNRRELVAAALELIGGSPPALNVELAADFLALGHARLQVELLARLRHTSAYIDDAHFDQCALAGSQAALAADEVAAREQLRRCFDCLYESRKQHYPIDISLVDLTLVAETTLGESLRRELARGSALNVLVSAALVAEMDRLHPATLAALREALQRGGATLVGGDADRLELPLAPIEAVYRELAAGRAAFERLAGRAPTIYGRRRHGLSPSLPQILVKFGFTGALHATLDEGRFPLGRQGKVRWEGADASLLDALAQLPLDAAEPGTFLELARKLAESMDADHVATLSFAHWPSLASPWLEDLRRIAEYSPVLGKFARLEEYFSQTAQPLVQARFRADEYRSPYLTQAVIRKEPDPISRHARAHRREAGRAAAGALRLLAALVRPSGNPLDAPTDPSSADASQTAASNDATLKSRASEEEAVERELAAALTEFRDALPRSRESTSRGVVVVNPHGFAVKHSPAVLVMDKGGSLLGREGTVPAAMVDTPGMGYSRVNREAAGAAKKRAKPIAEKNTLSGDHLLITISPNSGGIQSIHDLGQRTNRASQRLAMRMPGEPPAVGEPWSDPDESAIYATMLCDSLEATNLEGEVGEILTSGRLVDGDNRALAGFRQRARLRRDSRVVIVEIELEPTESPRADPWNSYFASRLAWKDDAAKLYRGVHLGRQETEAQRLEAPEYIDIVEPGGNVTLLAGGHPYHRRVGERTIDTLLVARGETARRFVLGIGVDLPHPHTAALELLRPPLIIDDLGRPPDAASAGWLFHLDTRSLVATHWAPIYTAMGEPAASLEDATPIHRGRPIGFRVRLLEANGRAGSATLRTPWNLAMARRTNFLGETTSELAVQGDSVLIDFGGHEWIAIEAWWA